MKNEDLDSDDEFWKVDEESEQVLFDETKCLDIQRRIPKLSKPLFDHWFSFIGTQHHSLAFVAVDILGILCTSASVEREFTKPKRILNFTRLRLLSDKVEANTLIVGNQRIADRVISEYLKKTKGVINSSE